VYFSEKFWDKDNELLRWTGHYLEDDENKEFPHHFLLESKISKSRHFKEPKFDTKKKVFKGELDWSKKQEVYVDKNQGGRYQR
jgi:hypothetical protein